MTSIVSRKGQFVIILKRFTHRMDNLHGNEAIKRNRYENVLSSYLYMRNKPVLQTRDNRQII